jgi:hypothetical protein
MPETYTYLSDEDKQNIITNHIRNLEYTMYNNEVSIIALTGIDGSTEQIDTLESENDTVRGKITALKALMS